MSGAVFAIIGMISIGLATPISSVPLKQVPKPLFALVRNLFVVPVVLLAFILSGADLIIDAPQILFTVGLSLLGYLGLQSYFYALQVGKIGIVVPVGGSSVLWTMIVSILFLGDNLRSAQIVAILIIVAAVMALSLNISHLKSSSIFDVKSGVPHALLTSICWGIMFALIKIPITQLGPIEVNLILEIGVVMWGALQVKLTGVHMIRFNRSLWIKTVVVAVLTAIAVISLNLAINSIGPSIANAIFYASPLIATIYAALVYRERLRVQQYLATIFVLVGIILLTLG